MENKKVLALVAGGENRQEVFSQTEESGRAGVAQVS